ncbi:histidine kinase [Christiangramia fulva]|uniref:Histidine kinase n=1 Tax=Christiangramia fulva TaxID=2126553 RepID=A0A2R3Z5G6_9FLAO|nr:LuxR C-terminal-related transcriptional regulator [Christiangramia fulva]AVR45510.1 histidine kinase [Christiangramia fulva]
MFSKVCKTLFAIVLSVASAYSQQLVPPIQSYSPNTYGGGSQNWEIAIDDKGVIYSANNQGLLVYDGLSWELLSLDTQSIIRAVYPFNNRIYTGSYNEFGYWSRNDKGQLVYRSLSPLMKDLNLRSDEFWQIISFKDDIYFRSFGAIYKYANNQIKKFTSINCTALETFKGHLVAAEGSQGISFFNEDGTKAETMADFKALQGKKIVDLKKYKDSLYIGTTDNLYIYSGDKLRSFPDPLIHKLLSEFELNHLLILSPNEIILGTLKNGIIHYKDGKVNLYNRTSGLQNNTVLGMHYAHHKLWLALDKGIDAIDLHSPFSFYTDKSGEIGAVYDIASYKNNYFIASNTGTYRFKDMVPEQIENSQSHTWNLELINGDLYANHNAGTFKIVENTFEPIDTHTGSYCFKEDQENKGKYLLCHYTGLSFYDPINEKLEDLKEVNFPVKKAVFDSDGSIWAAHPYEGIYHLFRKNDTTFSKIEKLPGLDGKANFSPQLYKVNDQIIVYLNTKWYKYNPFKGKFEAFKEFSKYNNCRLVYAGKGEYFFVDERDESVMYTDLKNSNILLPSDKFGDRLVKSNEKFIRENDSVFLIALNDGFARLNINKLKHRKEREWISTPFVINFSDGYRSYSLKEKPSISYPDSKNLAIRVGMPDSESSFLHYELSGDDSLEGDARKGYINLRNLNHGDYKLELSSMLSPGIKANTTAFNFHIQPPWYLSSLMKFVYILLVITLIAIMYWFNQQKLKKHQLQLETKFEKEHQDRLNQLEKERLMHEIDIKRKELANTTMMAAKKNEVLMEIQTELSKDKNKFSNQFRLKHIMNKINKAVKNKDEWKVFETNFNEVHEDFFKDVLKEYPKLTSKDLKLCSYLKMNLSSKEIAPLMGISVRGVEVHRYRLRKKMKLSSDVNLTKFLIKNF